MEGYYGDVEFLATERGTLSRLPLVMGLSL